VGLPIIALLAAVGASGWIYTKFMRRTGGNTKTALTACVAAGVVIFLFLWIVLNMIFKK
jgi:biotin transporter BioY